MSETMGCDSYPSDPRMCFVNDNKIPGWIPSGTIKTLVGSRCPTLWGSDGTQIGWICLECARRLGYVW